MLLKLLELSYPLDYVVFYDTGMEFEPIYEIEKRVKSMLKGIEYVRLTNERSFEYWMFEHVKKVARLVIAGVAAYAGGRHGISLTQLTDSKNP